VFGIELTDGDSAAKQVGSGADLTEDTEDLPHARFVSDNGAQELVLYAHYGAAADEYAEAEVRAAGEEALALKSLPTDTFVTQHGIQLGMTPAEVLERFGKCVKNHEKGAGSETIEYEIGDAENDTELKKYGYPLYYAEYEFTNGRLARFRFGFEYP
jgi:hypothetical protein